MLEWREGQRPLLRALVHELEQHAGWELVLLRTRTPASRPAVSRRLRGRMRVRTALTAAARADVLRGAAIFVPALDGSARLLAEAQTAGAAIASPPARAAQPELAAAETGAPHLRRRASARDAQRGEPRRRRDADVRSARRPRRRRLRAPRLAPPLARGHHARRTREDDWILADLHMHTHWSHDCSIDVDELLDHAEAEGLGAIAITDHNVFGGALEAVEKARGRKLIVIPGEEVKTKDQGEVIGLFLKEEIPRGMSFGETVEAIRAQKGIVYLPHPFDRMHAIPEPATIHRHLAEIDVLEIYNARLMFENYNDEAERFARKYNLLAGAGSDAHVLAGVGTGVVRMRRFSGPEEFLVSLHTAEVLRRPKSLVYLQGLKWVAPRPRRGSANTELLHGAP